MEEKISSSDGQRSARKRRSIFTSAGGLSFALLTLVMLFGTPAVTHAGVLDIVGQIVGSAADATFGLLLRGIGYVILTFSNGILYLVGVLFNFVITDTVFEFAKHFGNSQGMLAAWGVLRDISNIGLLFGFVFIGIATILNIHGYEVKKTLPRLIIFAVLLNFSLLAAEAIIDTANIFAVTLYTQSGPTCTGTPQQCATDTQNNGISGAIFQATGVSGIFAVGNGAAAPQQSDNNAQVAITYLEMSIFVVVVSVVLLAGAFLLISRAVVLAFLIILSPIGFAGLAIPFLEGYAKKWWSTLLSQSFFAPVYLLLIFISIKLMQGAFNGSPDLVTALTTGKVASVEAILIFALLIGFMVGALMVAKQLGAYGASFATNFATKAVSAPFAPLRYVAAWSGRSTANAVGSRAERVYNKIAAKDNAFTRTLRFTGIDESIAGSIAGVKNVKIDGKSHADRQKEREHRGHEIHKADSKEQLKTALTDRATGIAAGTAAGIAAAATAQKTIDEITRKMNLDDLAEIIKYGDKQLVQAMGEAVSPEKFEKLMESKELSTDKLEDLQKGRFAEVLSGTKDVAELATKDLEQLAKAYATEFETIVTSSDPTTSKSPLKDEQLEALGKSDRLTDAMRKIARDNTATRRLDNEVAKGAAMNLTDVNKLMDNMSGKQKAGLKAATLTNTAVIAKLDQNDLAAIMEEKKLSSPERAIIITQIKKEAASGVPTKRLSEIENNFTKNTFAAGQWGW